MRDQPQGMRGLVPARGPSPLPSRRTFPPGKLVPLPRGSSSEWKAFPLLPLAASNTAWEAWWLQPSPGNSPLPPHTWIEPLRKVIRSSSTTTRTRGRMFVRTVMWPAPSRVCSRSTYGRIPMNARIPAKLAALLSKLSRICTNIASRELICSK